MFSFLFGTVVGVAASWCFRAAKTHWAHGWFVIDFQQTSVTGPFFVSVRKANHSAVKLVSVDGRRWRYEATAGDASRQHRRLCAEALAGSILRQEVAIIAEYSTELHDPVAARVEDPAPANEPDVIEQLHAAQAWHRRTTYTTGPR